MTTERSNADAAASVASSGRPAQPEPFLRGCVWPAGPGAPYPRANPADFSRLPVDTWGTATLPVTVRFEFGGDTDAEAVEVTYTTRTDDFGYRGPGAGRTFALYADDECVAEEAADLGNGVVRLALGGRTPERFTVYLPEGMKPTVTAIDAVGGTITPAPPQPRWLCYGDSIAEGWIASGPAGAWPAIAGRRFGLDVVNLGYAGAARGEIVSAEHLAGVPADVISISHGTNCWTRIPHSVDQMRADTAAFVDVVRQGHPDTPIVVASPVLRPDAETTPNRLGATLVDLRRAIEDVVRVRIDTGDTLLTLVSGDGVLTAGHLPDGIHPGDDGHVILAETFGSAVAAALKG